MTYENRYECKFVVPEAVAARVLRRVGAWIEPDPHAASMPDHTYGIASLYLDDETNSLCRETREGRLDRRKLRVRSYGDGPLFLEVKSRRDRVVRKLRCPIPAETLPRVLAGETDGIHDLSAGRRNALHEFVRLVLLHRAVPRIVVRYDRQAYVGIDDDRHRVTFDRRLCAMPESVARVQMHDPAYVTIPTGGVILELKFSDRCPPWMLDTIRELQLARRSFSKYATCVDALFVEDRSGEH
ncbi:MAG: polyphosphate polymerase domain-containing protein [Planctomycetes bacterium]|nr:polyphosphate polymerase domain-containing protein [Planctomycetota bacterium]